MGYIILYYYGARYYSPWTCRFVSVDPLAGKYAQLTPYNYAGNEPIGDKDIDGMQSENTQPSGQSAGNSTQGVSLPKPDFSKLLHSTKQPPISPSVSTFVNTPTPPSLEQLNTLTPTSKIKLPTLNVNIHKPVSTEVSKPVTPTSNNAQSINSDRLPKYGADYASIGHNLTTGGLNAGNGKVHLGSDYRLYAFGNNPIPLSFRNDLGYMVTPLRNRPGFSNAAITFEGTELNQFYKSLNKLGTSIDAANVGIDLYNINKNVDGAYGDLACDLFGIGVQRYYPVTAAVIGLIQIIEPDEISRMATLNDLATRRNNSFSAYKDWQKGLDVSRNFNPPQLFLNPKN